MSGVVCAYDANGWQALEHAFLRMCRAAAYHGPEPCQRWTSGAVALAHVAFRTTPESDLEAQPTTTPDGRACVSFDGRLDNRSELLHLLPTLAPERVTDVDLVLAAYQRWGEDCVCEFVGDYAFALWDARLQRLFCARDPLGVRPLYYATIGSSFYAASGLEELMRSGAIPADVNEGIVAEYLTGELYSKSETLYQRAQRLPPGHRLVVDARGVRVSRYWYPERIAESKLGPVEATARFKALFEQAVRACARSNAPFGADLSGGLDSSSVASVLSELHGRSVLQQPFEAFTMTFPGLACDETVYASAVASQHRVRWNPVCCEPAPEVDYERLATDSCDFPGYPNSTVPLGLVAEARRKGIRVLLTGNGGDDWLDQAASAARTLDLLGSGQWRGLSAEWQGSSAHGELAGAARQLLAHGLARLGLHAPRRALRLKRMPRWIQPSLARRTDLAARISPPAPIPPGWSWSRARRLQAATDGACAHALEAGASLYRHQHVEHRHPFYDRRLVEFMIALPERYCGDAGWNKWLLREAMRGVLPESVRTRRTKADFSHTFRRTLDSAPVRRVFSTRPSAHDWVDGALVRRDLQRFLSGETSRGMWSLWGAYGIHAWAHTL